MAGGSYHKTRMPGRDSVNCRYLGMEECSSIWKYHENGLARDCPVVWYDCEDCIGEIQPNLIICVEFLFLVSCSADGERAAALLLAGRNNKYRDEGHRALELFICIPRR